jgi:hypothetical protein
LAASSLNVVVAEKVPADEMIMPHWLRQGKFVTVSLAEANQAISGALSRAASISALMGHGGIHSSPWSNPMSAILST